MRLQRKILIAMLLCFVFVTSKAQLTTNSGREFWFAFPEMYDNTNAVYWLNITSNNSCSGTVSIPGASWSTSFSITPGKIARVFIPSNLATIFGSNVSTNRGIRVISNNDAVVFAITYHAFRHEASLVLPNRALGKRYRITTFSSEIKSGLQESEFNIVAGNDTVVARITPKGNIAFGSNVNVPYTVTVLPNHVYQAQARSSIDDLSGTLIESLNNKAFSVYAGNVWSTIVCTPNSDPLLEGMFPTNTWGKDYFVLPTPNVNRDYIRVMADQDTTHIYRDGVYLTTLNAGQFLAQVVTSIRNYTSNKPISVAHFMITGQNNCSNYIKTDPSMVMLNATEQMFLDSITFFAVDTSAIDSHFVHVITGTADTGRMYLDSVKMGGFVPFTQNGNYSHKTINVKEGYHRLETQGCGFIAYSIGYGQAVSYAYATGVSLVDLSNSITYVNALTGTDTICTGDSVQFKSLIRGKPIRFSWNFGDGHKDSVQNPVHQYNTVGTFYIKAIIEYPCLTDTLLDTLVVPPPPIVDLGPDTVLCNKDTLKIKSANTRHFKTKWNNGSKDSSTTISQPGKYWVTVSNFCGAYYDTVTVDSLYPDTVHLGPDTLICQGDTIKLNIAAVWGSTYKWQDGLPYPIYRISRPGLYWAEVSNVCGTMRDSINVQMEKKPDINLGNDTILCSGQSLYLNATFSRSRYLWQNYSSSPYMPIYAPGGKYWVEVTNLCGIGRDTINVLYDYPANPYLGPDSIICTGDTILKDPLTGRGLYLWQDNSMDSVYQITGKGTYWIRVENVCGVYSDTINFVEDRTPQIQLPPDTLMCRGESIDLNASFSRSTYFWNTGATSPNLKVTTQGSYSVTTTNICGFDKDEILVLYDQPLNVNLGPDTFFCDFASFDAGVNFPNHPKYEWNTGQNSGQIRISHEGTYIITVTNRCGAYTDALIVEAMYTPEPNLPDSFLACQGQVVGLNANIPRELRRGVNYRWDNGHQDWKRGVKDEGKYWVMCYNQCGRGSDTTYVKFNRIPDYPMPDTIVCFGEELIYDFTDSSHISFLWNNQIESNYYVIDTSGQFVVKVSDDAGCASIERFEVSLCPSPFYAPNAFTPNGMEPNNVFRVFKTGIYEFELVIVNRWNQEVFRSADINEGWDGNHQENGTKCPDGKYVFKARFKEKQNHQFQEVIDEFYLIR